MVIRPMTISDYESVYHLWLETPNMGLNNLDDGQAGFEKYMKRNPNTCFVATSGAEVIGVILCGHDGRRGYIHHTAVKKSSQKCGIGKALVKKALSALEQEGIHKAALVVFKENANGNSFWDKQGFILRNDLNYRNKVITKMIRIDT